LNQSSSKSHKEIFKSTTIIGGASVINITLGILRTKVLALLLGPTGIGLLGIYNSILATASALGGCGLAVSGVRQIAEAQATNDQTIITNTRKALLWATLILAFIGAVLLFLLRIRISVWTFGNSKHAREIAILSVGVFVYILSGSQGALLNGLRRIGDLAKSNIFSALIGTILSILIILFFRERGIVFVVLTTAVTMFLATWYYSCKINSVKELFVAEEIKSQITKLLRLGIVFMATGFLNTGTQYVIRVVINRELGLEAIGYFQAAWSISMLYVGFVLDAMVKDYYPRLTAQANNHPAVNQLVNEQIEIALLLSGPLIIAMMTFAPLVINLLYAPSFVHATPILKWQVVGTLFKIISWAIGYIIVAKGRGMTFFCTELAWNFFYITGVWWGIRYFGLLITGISFFAAYSLYIILVYLIAINLTGFSLRLKNIAMLIVIVICLLAISLLSTISLLSSYFFGSIFIVTLSLYSVKSVYYLLQKPSINDIINKLKLKFYNK
jgi:enterobacterial common antigen flippase